MHKSVLCGRSILIKVRDVSDLFGADIRLVNSIFHVILDAQILSFSLFEPSLKLFV